MQPRFLSTRQAAALLGISEASIKRFCDARTIPCLRKGRARRLDLRDLIAVLRRRDPAEKLPASSDAFARAIETGRLDSCALRVAELCLEGLPLVRCFDTLLVPARAVPGVVPLVRRIEGLASVTIRSRRAPVVIASGTDPAAAADVAMAAVTIRARGFAPLTTPPGTRAAQLANVVRQTGAVFVVLTGPNSELHPLVSDLGPSKVLVLSLGRGQSARNVFEDLDARLRALPLG